MCDWDRSKDERGFLDVMRAPNKVSERASFFRTVRISTTINTYYDKYYYDNLSYRMNLSTIYRQS